MPSEVSCARPSTEDEIGSAFGDIVAGLAEEDNIGVKSENKLGDTDEGVRYGISGDWLVHFTALRGDPQLTSWAIKRCSGFNASALMERRIASILRNAMGLCELLEISKKEIHFTPALYSIRTVLLGEVEGTRDTALHFVATYSTKEEFAGVMVALARAAEAAKPWDDFYTDYDLSYLFGLQNGNGETVLHRAAAMSNFGVVSYICERAPDVTCRLDSMNRSALWHAACGGDEKIISAIGAALRSLQWALTIDYPDDNGVTPLHVACRQGYEKCVTALLDLGARPLCAAQSSGLTPIHYASLFGHSDCLSAMAASEHFGARLDFLQVVRGAEDADLIRPIHLAAANGWEKCVRLLIEYGSPMSPRASFVCIARISPARIGPTLITKSTEDLFSRVETEVQVEAIQPSTPVQVADREGWTLVVSILKEVTSHQPRTYFLQHLAQRRNI